MSEDPIGFEGGDKNLYNYVLNNALKYNDPSGEVLSNTVKAYIKLRLVISGLVGEVFTMCQIAPDTCQLLLDKLPFKEKPKSKKPDPKPIKCNPSYQTCDEEIPNKCSLKEAK